MKTNSLSFAHVLAGLGLLFVAGCSTGGGSLQATPASSTSAGGRGAMKVTIHWPQLPPKSRLIPLAAQSIRLTLSSGSSTVADTHVGRPTTSNTSTITLPDIPVGTYTETATAYPNADATGTAQAQGSQSVTVLANQTVVTPDLTMNTTIKAVTVTPSATTVAAGGADLQLTATAKDAAGNVVLTAPSNFKWTADHATLATFTPNDDKATLKPLSAGTVSVTAQETESGVFSTALGIIITTATSPPASSNVFVADTGNNRVVGLDKIPATNFATYLAYNPQSVALDTKGRLYIGSYSPGSSKIIRVDDVTGTNQATYAPAGSTASYIALDRLGRIYFYDDNHALNRMDDITGANRVTYNPTNQFGSHLLNGATGFATDSRNRIYVLLGLGAQVVRFDDMTGANTVRFGARGSGVNQFQSPSGIAIDSSDRIYVADAGNHRIVRFDDMTGKNWTMFAVPSEISSQNTAGDAVAVDSGANPHIYFTDASKGIVYRMDDMNGTNLVQYGANGSGNGQFQFPISLAAK